jgi:hypothetical protein
MEVIGMSLFCMCLPSALHQPAATCLCRHKPALVIVAYCNPWSLPWAHNSMLTFHFTWLERLHSWPYGWWCPCIKYRMYTVSGQPNSWGNPLIVPAGPLPMTWALHSWPYVGWFPCQNYCMYTQIHHPMISLPKLSCVHHTYI